MVEYLIRVECAFGTFMVAASHSKSFARQMCQTFTLRDINNIPIPHTKSLVEMHTEEKDAGLDGPVEIPKNTGSFEDFEETYTKEKRHHELQDAERRVDEAVRIMQITKQRPPG